MKPIVWSIAGNDSGGGAGLTADQRMADACGVHLCPIVSGITAQNSRSVDSVYATPLEVLEAQLQTLASDMPPRAIKTGLLANAAQVHAVARWVDTLRQRSPHPIALVVDPVLRASTGAQFADADTLAAYQTALLPRTTLLTPNRREAALLLGHAAQPEAPASALPAQASALRSLGVQGVCITGGDSPAQDDLAIDWLATPQASGWLALPRIATAHHHGTGCSFATAAAAALARGFVSADAAVLAKMATAYALARSYAAGEGSGPVHAGSGFCADADTLPRMSWGQAPYFAPLNFQRKLAHPIHGLYAIVDTCEQLVAVLATGVRTVQLRIKTPVQPSAQWHASLEQHLRQSIAACAQAGASLLINDHMAQALALQAPGLHLGQEDLLALSEMQRQSLMSSDIALGISSHSLWELARARSLAPSYIACGPVWPTTTKDMPWHAQGMDNLAWWCRMAGRPVVAIGGILQAAQITQAAQAGASAVCIVRAIGADPRATVPALQRAFDDAQCMNVQRDAAALASSADGWPHPSL
jgi:hydroxymethylpyrimidine kinase / phosphomethylpyrimidine kinase / thiamine-phosphate diphosphorylase